MPKKLSPPAATRFAGTALGTKGGEADGAGQTGYARLPTPHSLSSLFPLASVSAQVQDDGCAVVFAPVTSEPSSMDEVVVRYLDANGQVITEDRGWLGDGGPPPPEVLREWRGGDAG